MESDQLSWIVMKLKLTTTEINFRQGFNVYVFWSSNIKISLTGRTDHKIIELLNSPDGKNSGINLLLDVYGQGIYGFILSFVHQEADADDVFQNVLIKVSQKSKTFNWSASLKTWLYQLAKNESIDFLRKRKRMAIDKNPDELQIAAKLAEEPFFDGDEVLARLHEAVTTLPQVQREVFIMRYFEAMSYREIAEISNKSEGALKTSFFYASKKIAQILKDLL